MTGKELIRGISQPGVDGHSGQARNITFFSSNQGLNLVTFADFPVHVKGKGAQERQL